MESILENTTQENTTNKLYGAWITPSGDMIPVQNKEEHWEIFQAVILHGKATKRYYYSLAYRLGYLRLKFVAGGYNIECSLKNRKAKSTKQQTTWIENALFVDGVISYNDKIAP
jgi:hypothetical protein